MKDKLILLVKFLLLTVGGGAAGSAAMAAVYLLPVARMDANVRSSMEVFYTESVYPQQAPGYKTTQLDNETDAIMLLGAIYDGGGESFLKQSMRVARVAFEDVSSNCNGLIRYAWENQTPDSVRGYSRYWHGYMLWLKPLLLFLDYADIRMLNMMLQTFLLLYLVRELAEKGMKRYLPAFLAALVVINPAAVSMSLQFSSIYYIILISMILVMKFHKKWDERKRYPQMFYILGMLTVFFDFLTYPVAALCMPLILVLLLGRKDWRTGLKEACIFSICFGAGYAGMWFGKWAAASLILQENVIGNAVAQIGVHTAEAVVTGETLSHAGAVLRNMKVLWKWPYFIFFTALFLFCALKVSWRKAVKRLPDVLPVLAVSLIPFAWLYVTSSHAVWCYWYTYRGLMASVFGGFCILLMLPERKAHGK